MPEVTKVSSFLDETKQLLEKLDPAAIVEAKKILVGCYHRKGRVYLMGNGGSASTAQHFACDLGFDGGILHRECDCSMLVPVESTPQTEAIHVVIQHLLMQIIKEELAQGLPRAT